MSTITIAVGANAADGSITPLTGKIWFYRLIFATSNVGSTEWVIAPVPVAVTLVSGIASVELDNDYWLVREFWTTGRRFAIHLTADIDYADLVLLDPASLTPSATPDPAWQAALAATQAEVEQLLDSGTTPVFVGTTQPTVAGEFAWFQTDGSGNLIDIKVGSN